MNTSDYFERWFSGKIPELERSTQEAYDIYLHKHIIPYFDFLGKELADLKPLDIKDYVTYKRKNGRKDGKSGGLSPVSVRKHLNIIKQALRDAVLYELIAKSPAEPVKLPRSSDVTEKAKFIPIEDAKAIIKAFDGHKLQPAVYITLLYGLRRSEILGLKWHAIDLESGTLSIRHTVVKNTSIECKDKTKTSGSRRVFPILPESDEIFRKLLQVRDLTSDYVFHRDNGEPLRPDTLTRSFQRVLNRNGLPRMRFHDLRHATASILFDQGWSVPDVQHWLGHTDIETTINIYVAYSAARKLRVGGSLAGIFSDI